MPATIINLNSAVPAAPSGQQNVAWQADSGTPIRNVTAYLPDFVGDAGSGGLAGAVPAPSSGYAAAGYFLAATGAWAVPAGSGGGGGGTVTSVTVTMPAEFTVSGSPITSAGTIAVGLATEPANEVWAGPTSGSAAVPTFRALVAADIPTLSGYGTVTSVAVTMPAIFTTSGSPITSAGTIAVGLANESANLVWAGPSSGSAAAPAFRALVAADGPAMVGDTGSGGAAGLVPAPGAGTAAAGDFLRADGAWAAPTATTNSQLRTIGAVLTPTALTACVYVPFSGTVTAFHAVAGDGATANTVLVKVKTQPTFATFISTGVSGASDISNGGEQLTSVLGLVDVTLSSWSTTLTAGTTVCFVGSTFSSGTSVNANITIAAN